MWAIVGGSGFEQFEDFEVLEVLSFETPFGMPSSGLSKVSFCGQDIIFLPRHGAQHEKLPSEVNYPANVYALKMLGVTKVLSLSAVGSYDIDLKPGDAVSPSQYVDMTKSIRRNTFCGDGLVAHVSVKQPVHPELVKHLRASSECFEFTCHFDKVYVCEEGPHFTTLKEASVRKQLGYDVVGQTNYPEYVLMKEAGIAYLPVCFVSNYDAWADSVPDLPISEIMAIIRSNKQKAYQLAKKMISEHPQILPEGCKEEGLTSAALSDIGALSEEVRARLNILL